MLSAMFETDKPIIGMLHLSPLPGSPGYGGALSTVIDDVLADLEGLIAGGVHGIMIENFGDIPFYPDRVPAVTVSHMTAIAARIRRATDLPLGINCLRNDGRSALAIAHAADAQFIRVNVLVGARVTDQGVLQGIAHELLRDRANAACQHIRIWADVNVKHSAPLAEAALDQLVYDLTERGRADALIVTGSGTGRQAEVDELKTIRTAAEHTPVFVGSGVTAENLPAYRDHADGFIVGTSIKLHGETHNPVDSDRVKAIVAALA